MTDVTERFRAARDELLADRSRTGLVWARAMASCVDGWLAEVFDAAVAGADHGRGGGPLGEDGLALVAIGGYGRGELCPGSDIDVLLLHQGRKHIAEVAERLWYPVWDGGVPLGHSVRTPKEALKFATGDLALATSLLSCRHLAGDPALVTHLSEAAFAQWRKRGRHNVAALADAVTARQARAGEVAYLLEPDVKDGRGGQRDVHALGWAEVARPLQTDDDPRRLDLAYETLVAVRVELQRLTGRRGNALALQYQDAVADALGDRDADTLMGRVAEAARSISWTADQAWDRARSWLRGPGAASGQERVLGEGLVLSDGVVQLVPGAEDEPGPDPTLVLRAASAAARHQTRIDRASLRRLADTPDVVPPVWPAPLRVVWEELLGAGHAALPVIEALDQVGLWVRYIPEWDAVRNRPQRNAYHRFTVDRHLLETVANAAEQADRVSRPDLLVTGALLHDLGKGQRGDHVEVGERLAATVGTRMGFPPDDIEVLQALVRQHLLLPDTATRRDLADPATAERMAEAVGSPMVLDLLHALCEADSLATGPSAWSPWKAELVDELVTRTRRVLEGEPPPTGLQPTFPSADQAALLQAGETALRTDGDVLTVVAEDRPGLLSRVAGTLALHGLEVLSADAVSTTNMALERFKVAPAAVGARDAGADWTQRWPRVVADVERAIAGRLAVDARVSERARLYLPAFQPRRQGTPEVNIDNEASVRSTVVEVSAADSVGLLYRVTRALADLDLDVNTAKVQTLGERVVDAFYVVDSSGDKVTGAEYLAEIERAVLDAVPPRR